MIFESMLPIVLTAFSIMIGDDAEGDDQYVAAAQAWSAGDLILSGEHARDAMTRRIDQGELWSPDMARLAFMVAAADRAQGEQARSRHHFHIARLQHRICGSDLGDAELALVEREAAGPGESFRSDRLMLSSPYLRPGDAADCEPASMPTPSRPQHATGDRAVGVAFADVRWNSALRVRSVSVLWAYPASLETRARDLVGTRALNGHSGEGFRAFTLDPCMRVPDEQGVLFDFCMETVR